MQSIGYTWDEEKAKRNIRFHEVAFEDAIKIFDGPTVERLDDRFDYAEERGMSKRPTSNTSDSKTDWDRVERLTNERVRRGIEADPDAHPTDPEFWRKAEIVMPQRKETITIRLDADVLDWFRKQGKGYQTRMNAVLRSYVRAHRDET